MSKMGGSKKKGIIHLVDKLNLMQIYLKKFKFMMEQSIKTISQGPTVRVNMITKPPCCELSRDNRTGKIK